MCASRITTVRPVQTAASQLDVQYGVDEAVRVDILLVLG
jgi:hypothetical protein